MENFTIKSFAKKINIPVDQLLQKFFNLGIVKSTLDIISKSEQNIILSCLENLQTETFTIKRKKRSILKFLNTNGKDKFVQIEIKKHYTYSQYDYLIKEKNKNKENKEEHLKKLLLTETVYKNEKNNESNLLKEKENKINIINSVKNFENVEKNLSTSISNKTENILSKKDDKNNILINSKESRNKIKREIVKESEDNRKIIDKRNKKNKKYNDTWKNPFKNKRENNLFDYHLTNSLTSLVQEENDHKIGNSYSIRKKNNKTAKQKKTNKLSFSKINIENSKNFVKDKKNKKRKNSNQDLNKSFKKIIRNVSIGETITVSELANQMAVKSSIVIKEMMQLGVIATINQIIDQETAILVVEEMGHKFTIQNENQLEQSILSEKNFNNNTFTMKKRAPIVTVMGHVDHGKTSLLDYIRSTKLANEEIGGITQRIGAYRVETKGGMITFIDTPGHSAFSNMRTRGAKITDIIVLVIAADDGVMPQSIETIQLAKLEKIPIIVAINKIDKSEIDIESIKNKLTEYGIVPEEWGGENQFVNISAKLGTGINDLLDAVLLQSEILEIKSFHEGKAKGVVIESFLDKGRGPVATVLIKEGLLNCGDIVLCGLEYGKIRAIQNEKGHNIFSAGPSVPVEIFGLSGIPRSGDILNVVNEEKKAREVSSYRRKKFREDKLYNKKKVKTEDIFDLVKKNNLLELRIILKSNTYGSVESVSNVLKQLSTNKIAVNIISKNIGNFTETDISLSMTSQAILLGFNVGINLSAKKIVEKENLNFKNYSIIYNLINDIKKHMKNMIEPEYKEKFLGLANVRNVFSSLQFGTIAGCIVIKGSINRNSNAKVVRNNKLVFTSKIESLRRFKEDVNEVRSGIECGISIKDFNEICTGDIIETFELLKKE